MPNPKNLSPTSGLMVKRQSLSERCSDVLREAIITGDIKPGARLTEAQLAQDLSVSQGTLRTALMQLEGEGFTSCAPHSAWRVAALGGKEIWEAYTFRAALESMAARLVASRINDKIRTVLIEHLEALEGAKTATSRAEKDLALHQAIIRYSGHGQLSETYSKTLNRIRWIYATSEAHTPARIDLHEWHAPLVNAICAGKQEDAAKIAHDMIMASMSDDMKDIAHFDVSEKSA